ncbi:hypothetical protein [Staphylococcus marylandisciuri]|nr:hypothetical protein [Staphylococcus marylandisciuri]
MEIKKLQMYVPNKYVYNHFTFKEHFKQIDTYITIRRHINRIAMG